MDTVNSPVSPLRLIVDGQIDLDWLRKNYFRDELKIPEGQAIGPHVRFKGEEFLQITGQDYLSLSSEPRVEEAAIKAIQKYGVGALGSPIITGTLDIHIELQEALATFMGAEKAVVFMTGMLANIGAVPAIIHSPYRAVKRGNRRGKRAIFKDERSHTSLMLAADVCEAHNVGVINYRHLDVNDLDSKLREYGCDSNLIVTDTLFSMHGTIAPMGEIVAVAKHYSDRGQPTVVYGDSAHDVGIIGQNGRGICELCGVEGDVVRMGVLSKAFGTLGGFIVGDEWFAEYIAYSSTHMFSLSLPPAETAATTVAIQIATEEPWRRTTLLAHAEFLRTSIRDAGFDVLGDGTQIVAVVIGDENECTRISRALEENHILCPEIKFPAVPKGGALLRLSPVYDHKREDLERFVKTLKKVAHIRPSSSKRTRRAATPKGVPAARHA